MGNRSTKGRLGMCVLALAAALPGTVTATDAVAESAGRPQVANVQKALETVAETPRLVGVIGEVYHDGKGSAGSRLPH